MQLRRFAEQVLFGNTLEDKLLSSPRFDDDDRGPAIALPAAPGRPADLPLRSPGRAHFPASARLGEPDAAATALHAFANHELLALELMALALLRFPDAPPAFRSDLVRTLQEEQAHLRLYLDRLSALGQTFGSRPLSAYFWDTLSTVQSTTAFCAAMGLTLEQANLDFAGHFAAAFEEVGDTASAKLLRRVLTDEITHVARGLRWFDRLRGDGDRWEDWVGVLPAPLTPRRARGPDFAVGARLRAGLDPDFVQRVRTHGASRGRPSDVHWLNVPVEAGDGARARGWIRDLEATAIFRASDDDIVLLQRRPGRVWLARLAEAGFDLPAIVHLDETRPLVLDGPVRALRPWAPTPGAVALLGDLGELQETDPPDKLADVERLRCLLPTLGPPERRLPDDALPIAAPGMVEVDDAIAAYRSSGYHRLVFKRALGTSGRGQLRLFEDGLLPEQRAWLEAALGMGPVRVEPWLDRCLDLSFQLDASGFRGIVRFDADATGRFRSAALERPTVGLSQELSRFWAGDGQDVGWIERVGQALAAGLAPIGPTGVDALIYRAADGLRLHPYVERNPRVTFGRLALDLRARLAPGCVGRWMILGPAELKRTGAPSLARLAKMLEDALPLERRRGQLQRIALPTADPDCAEVALPMLLVAPTAAELRGALESCIPQGGVP